jgi:hypothetical protein
LWDQRSELSCETVEDSTHASNQKRGRFSSDNIKFARKKGEEIKSMTTITDTMKAAILMGSNQLEIKEILTPKPGPMEVLLKVDSCACCSTDVALMDKPFPGQPPYGSFVPGHE